MSAGIRRRGIEGKRVEYILPEDLVMRFQTLCWDHSRDKPIFGRQSQIVTQLVKTWVEAREQELAQRAPTTGVLANV